MALTLILSCFRSGRDSSMPVNTAHFQSSGRFLAMTSAFTTGSIALAFRILSARSKYTSVIFPSRMSFGSAVKNMVTSNFGLRIEKS